MANEKEWPTKWETHQIEQDHGHDPWIYSCEPVLFSKDNKDSGLSRIQEICQQAINSELTTSLSTSNYKYGGWWIPFLSSDTASWVESTCASILELGAQVMVHHQLFAGHIFPELYLTDRWVEELRSDDSDSDDEGNNMECPSWEARCAWAATSNEKSGWNRWNCLADALLLKALLDNRSDVLQWLGEMVCLHHQARSSRTCWPVMTLKPSPSSLGFASCRWAERSYLVDRLETQRARFTPRGLLPLFSHIPSWQDLLQGKKLFTLNDLCHRLNDPTHPFVVLSRNWRFDSSSPSFVVSS